MRNVPAISGASSYREIGEYWDHHDLAEEEASTREVRDYHAEERSGTRFVPYGVRRRGADRIALFQVWEWESEHYALHFYFTFDDGQRVMTRVFRSRYYAVSIDRLMALAGRRASSNVGRIDGAFFQPLITARRPTCRPSGPVL